MDKLNELFQTETGRAVCAARVSIAVAEGKYAQAKTLETMAMWSNEIERRIDALILAAMDHQKYLTEQAMTAHGVPSWSEFIGVVRNS